MTVINEKKLFWGVIFLLYEILLPWLAIFLMVHLYDLHTGTLIS